ncbi:DNA repair-scaffolding protein-like [Mizuhopecten yessoensis]|uniref:DNA repair-scaffolding protein-like n=1 Tax=Mizuhopecten yessoensis TaxID=6573 RepID=UPI000B45B8A9|nr:DNA repair-scaffolding protein-like [Mizuhopecten yessoensis]
MSQYYGKRKLIYSPEKEDRSYSQRKIQEKRKPVGKWQSFGEGFSGFAGTDHNNPTKRQKGHLIGQRVANISGELPTEVAESIAWSSSDDDDDESEKQKSRLEFSPVVRRSGPRYKAGVQKDCEDPAVIVTDDESSSEAWWCQSGMKNKATREKADSENQGGKHSQVSDVTANICSYESEGSRLSFSQKETDENLQSLEISQDIESMESQSPAPSQASSSSKVKASDWVKTLNLKTPSKDSQSGDTDILEDSAKKKKKFKRGGFADQLNKVQMRERSSLRIWSHQQNSTELESQAVSTSKIITIEVVSFELLYSLQLARCEVLTGLVEPRQILVLFSAAVVQQHNIQEGSIVRIHPPWQQLDLKQTNQKVLLCTNYCQVVNSADLRSPGSRKVTRQPQQRVKVTGRWNCPCVADLVRTHQSCPAYLLPSIPAVAVSRDPLCCDEQEDSERSRLTVIQATQPARSATKSAVSHTILDSIHRQGSTREGQGHSFSALVHRVLQKRTRQTSRWCLLVEDIQGTMCEVILPKDRLPMWEKVLQGEGTAFSFHGLTVYSRTNRERDFSLFTLIDSVWSGVASSTLSQESDQVLPGTSGVSEESEQALPAPSTAACTVEPPGFCYIMKGDNSTNVDVTPIDTPALLSRYRPLSLTDLSKACRKPAELKRFCFVAKVLAILPSETRVADARGGSGTAPHLGPSHCYVYVWSGVPSSEPPPSYSTVRVVFDIVNTVCGKVMFFKDVFYHKEQLCCDGYSQILPITDVPDACLSTNSEITTIEAERRALQGEITIPNICSDLPDLSLCKAIARVRGVDESSAYSWDVCNYCGSDKLITRQSELTCLECHKSVLEPLTKMTMDVKVTCDGLDIPVTVSLLQDCIERLLPEETAEEGYDIESVLGKDIGTIFCVLCSRTVRGEKVENLKLRQIDVAL